MPAQPVKLDESSSACSANLFSSTGSSLQLSDFQTAGRGPSVPITLRFARGFRALNQMAETL
jgi:hypothetical protein